MIIVELLFLEQFKISEIALLTFSIKAGFKTKSSGG